MSLITNKNVRSVLANGTYLNQMRKKLLYLNQKKKEVQLKEGGKVGSGWGAEDYKILTPTAWRSTHNSKLSKNQLHSFQTEKKSPALFLYMTFRG